MMNVLEVCLNPGRAVLFVFLCVQLLKCVLRDLLKEKEAQKNLLQVHLNGTDSPPNLMVFIEYLIELNINVLPVCCRSPAD